jgi:hypothetical protein
VTKFAEGTSTPVEKTRAEIEATLSRFGADAFNNGFEPGRAWVMFRAKGRWIKLMMTLPDPAKFALTPSTGKYRTPKSQQEAVAAENRRLWRCLLLLVKAKLAAVSDGIVEFDQEFMPHIVTETGQTVYEAAKSGAIRIPYAKPLALAAPGG